MIEEFEGSFLIRAFLKERDYMYYICTLYTEIARKRKYLPTLSQSSNIRLNLKLKSKKHNWIKNLTYIQYANFKLPLTKLRHAI